MQQRTLGRDSALTVSALGLGCMGMSEFYGETDEAESVVTIKRAIELGVTFFDTADMYGVGHNEELVGRALEGQRDSVVVATKFGIVRSDDPRERRVDSSGAYAKQAVEASLRRLNTDYIDLYYMHRRNPQVPIEETVGALAELVVEGKIRHIGLSEVSADTLRAACAVHPITALQSEWSLFTRGIEARIVPTARELGVGIVPYSPIGRGFLTGRYASIDDLAEDDFRRYQPRFQGDNLDANVRLVARVREIADEVGCTPAQLALAWLLHQGDDVVPIPGTKRVTYLEENVAAAAIELSDDQLAALDEAMPAGAVAGDRYPAESMGSVEL
jgi:aryl-alcohol dehydrogenase-like predicted oxidoreductase